MTNDVAVHEHINYLDSIILEEEARCEYSHECRSFSISRSGRFKSNVKKRNSISSQFNISGSSQSQLMQDSEKVKK